MKYKNFLFLLIIILSISGCSSSKGNNSPTKGPTPTLGTSPTVTNAPTNLPTQLPTSTPTPTEELTNDGNPDSEIESTALQILNQMSLEEKVGQMFFVRCNNATAMEDLKNYHLGGFILFSADFSNQTKSSMKEIISGYQSASDIPLLIGVDEEGGTVNRISKYTAFRKVPFQSPQELYQSGGFDLVKNDTIEKTELLKSLGINTNLAPVCDVSTDTEDFIYKRSFGQDAEKTAEYVETVVTAMNEQGIGCTLKHFPGYGNNIDTHTGIAIDKRSSEQFYANDFLPFEAGISAGAGSILVSHNVVMAFDKTYPASLSRNVHNILRNDLKFNGVIMTDDLSMDAIKDYTNNEAAAVLAVQAGNDLIIASDYSVQIPAVIAAVKNEEISFDDINESVLRILKWKLSLGLFKK
ncbi:MAG: beta-hexosaminidase [Herbinix sp.]|jgi:beta-N-acetylhexosaminidase|nr:beta-hexosaminidase [Herbinix sp.]